MKILVVDDDAELRGLVGFTLRQDGHAIVEAVNGADALATFAGERPDLVILDVNMPVMNGFEALRRLRAGSDVPVMMLTVMSSEEDQVRGLDLGADDYLVKPFSPRTLLARVRALSRRAGAPAAGPVTLGDLRIDADAQTVRLGDGAPIRLTALELRLLLVLVPQAGRVVAPERLARDIWGYQGIGDRTRLKQLVHRLRQKLEQDPAGRRYLVTVPGAGYALRPEGVPPA